MSVPLARLFSLDLLKAFVAVGRRMSITQAAEDLCLTQPAVSRQVQALEQQIGSRLFVRQQRGVAFTPEGLRLFRAADAALLQLQEAAAELAGPQALQTVTLTSSSGILGVWLLPRLSRLQQRHPSIELRLSASNTLSDLRAEGVDLAVRYARDLAMPPGAIRLFDETLAPVAHPQVAEALRHGERCPLLAFDDTRPWLQWRHWFDPEAWHHERRPLLHFNQYDQVIQAALAAQGVAIGRMELLQPLIDDGRLEIVPLRCAPMKSPNAVWLLLADDAPRPAVRQVAEWLEQEAAQVRAWRPPA